MNSIIRLIKIIFLVFGLTWSLSSFSTPITWNLSFYDGTSGLPVGSGNFIYNTATSDCIATGGGYNGCGYNIAGDPSTGYVSGFDIQTKIDSITFNLVNLAWGVGSGRELAGDAWWNSPSSPVKAQGTSINNQGSVGIFNHWLFRNGSVNQSEVLFMRNFSMISSCLWTGTWLIA
jgi:hypothetical protein